ncbi:MAG: hypothetical protein ACJ76H_03205 [Bacteriovoracaceae bacterium]
MKQLKIFFAVLMTAVTLTHTKPSQAAVGAFVGTPVLIAGLAIGGAGIVTTIAGVASCKPGDSSGLCQGLIVLVFAPVVLLGLVVLEGEQKVEFRELSKEEANKLGISSNELAVYNSEVDQANMLVADVSAELSKIEKPTSEDSGVAWSKVKDLVSPETFATMQKIVSQK